MLEAGEDPLFVVRRLVILASEDIGLADPQALSMATACKDAVQFVGMPEGFYAIAECALYLALAPKSNSVGAAYAKAQADAKNTGHLPVPLHLRNAVTSLMSGLGYGEGYRYAHDEPGHFTRGETHLPEELGSRTYFQAGKQGAERQIWERFRRLVESDGSRADEFD